MVFIVLQIAISSSLIYYIFQLKSEIDRLGEQDTTQDTSTETEDEQEQTTTLEKIDLDINVSAHLVWWDQDKGFESIQNYGEFMYSVSPFWYELTIEGTIEPFSGAADEEVISFLETNNIKILPVLSNEFRTEPLSSIIADPSKKQKQIEDIVAIAADYDGISLNYENLNATDKDNYTTFVTDLAEELHNDNKLLGIHLHAKTDEPGTWNGPQSQDWEALGNVCDKMKIMAYDYHWSTSEAGAIAPPDWVENVVKYAVELIPKEKVYLGVPLYGYDWVGKVGEGVTYAQATTIANLNNATVNFDNATKSNYFTYTKAGDSHEVWFEDATSASSKLQLAKQYEIGGVDFWRLGSEDIKVWNEVEQTFKVE